MITSVVEPQQGGGLPMIQICVAGKLVPAVVDTGAAQSAVCGELGRAAGLVGVGNTIRPLVTANGDPIETLGEGPVAVALDGVSVCLHVVVIPRLPFAMLLGMDWVRMSGAEVTVARCGVRVTFPGETALCPDEQYDPKLRVRLHHDVSVPPSSMTAVEVVAAVGDGEMVLDMWHQREPGKELFIPRQLVEALEGVMWAFVVNPGTHPIILCTKKSHSRVDPLDRASPICCLSQSNGPIVPDTGPAEPRLEWKIGSQLSAQQRQQLTTVLDGYADMFSQGVPLCKTDVVTHHIDTGDSPPIRMAPHRVHPEGRREMQRQVEEMLQADVIEESRSPWASPVVLVRKRNGTWRVCADYRQVNAVTRRRVWPLPRVDDALDRLKGARFFTSLDLVSGFWQVEMAPEDREKTAFITPDGLYQFKRMSFGLCNSPATFQRLMDKVLGGLKWTSCLVYMDDVLVHAETFEEHQRRLKLVLDAIQGAGLSMNPSKCSFAMPSTLYLGHQIDVEGIRPDPEKLRAVKEYPTPKKVRDVRAFLGLSGYFRRFMQDYSLVAVPLFELTKTKGRT